MTTYIVRVMDREDGLRGVVSEVATGQQITFTDARSLLVALAAVDLTDHTAHDRDEPGEPVNHANSPRADIDLTRRGPLGIIDPLTRSQLRVCRLAALGKSNTDIAEELFVTRATVESHLHASYRKLGIGSRFALPLALFADVA